MGVFDPAGKGIEKDIQDLGIAGVKKVTQARVFIICGDISEQDARRIAKELLTDPITQDYLLSNTGRNPRNAQRIVEIAYNPGVMDPVEDSTKKAIKDLGIHNVESIKTEKKYYIEGKITGSHFKTICERLLYNKVIQHVVNRQTPNAERQTPDYRFKLIIVDILKADDGKLKKISKEGQLFLNLKEMRKIQKYFRKLRRNPTDCELETIAQTWSEHCAHKTFRGIIDYKECDKVTKKQSDKVTNPDLLIFADTINIKNMINFGTLFISLSIIQLNIIPEEK